MNHTEYSLTCMSEKCVELSKNVHKALLFGLDYQCTLDPAELTVKKKIIADMNDLEATIILLESSEIIPVGWRDSKKQLEKINKLFTDRNYTPQTGSLKDE